MQISDVQTFIVGNPWKNWVFIKLHTDEGVHGIGEATAHRGAKTMETALIEYRRYYLHRDPFDLESIHEELDKSGAPAKVKAAVDIACLDIIGKTLGVPIYRLIGGLYRGKIKAYANGWYQTERTPEAFAEKAKGVVNKGYLAMKFDPFGSAYGTLSREELNLSISIVEAVREAVGPDVDLFIECHGRFNPATAIRIGRMLESFDPGWIEEPMRSNRMDEMAAVGSKLSTPVAGGEGLAGVDAFHELFLRKSVQIAQPDTVGCGGITEMKKICELAKIYGIMIAPHNAMGPVGTAAALHVDASTSNIMIQEVFEDFATPLAAKIVDHPIEIKNGELVVSQKPGLGMDLMEDEIAKHPYDESHFLDLYGSGGWEKRTKNKPVDTA